MELGLNVTVWPFPSPDADKLSAELNPPAAAAAIVTFPDEFLVTVMLPGEAETAKPAVALDVTVSDTVVVWVNPPPVPVMVME
jgi:hypothetical protein